jgi:cardiolipin synthase
VQINLRNHRKVLIVDGVRAFTGGLNLHDGHLGAPGREAIRDYHFDIAGPVVQELQYSFLRDWAYMTGEEPDLLFQTAHFPHQPAAGTMPVRVINSGPSVEQETINDVFFMAITSARRQLWIVTPYFVPGPDILQAIRAAARRGVDVRLVVPRENNHVYAGLAGQALYGDLLACGVRIFERAPPFMHAKAMVIDDTLALVGTANLDIRSLRLNYETNLAVYSAAFVADMRQLAQQEMACSRELELAAWRTRPLRRKLLENACSLFTPIL